MKHYASMAAAASSVLRNQISGTFYPYILDSMANEVDSERRFDSVHFPDIPIQGITSTSGYRNSLDDSNSRGSLSYTVGDFVGNDDYYYHRQRVGHFDAVVSSINSDKIYFELLPCCPFLFKCFYSFIYLFVPPDWLQYR